MSSTDLSSRVAGLNPRWNGDASAAATDAGFAQAVALTGREFEDAVDYTSKVRRAPRGASRTSGSALAAPEASVCSLVSRWVLVCCRAASAACRAPRPVVLWLVGHAQGSLSGTRVGMLCWAQGAMQGRLASWQPCLAQPSRVACRGALTAGHPCQKDCK